MSERRDEQRQHSQAADVRYADGFAALEAGDTCPRCGDGVLIMIGRGKKSVTLTCFMCQTTGSHNPEKGFQAVTRSPRETPTGFTLSPAQIAARDSADPEEAAAANLTAEHGSGVVSHRGGSESG